jgi:hypothetical protein
MIAMMMVGMATVGGGGCEAGEMLPLLKRHEIQMEAISRKRGETIAGRAVA